MKWHSWETQNDEINWKFASLYLLFYSIKANKQIQSTVYYSYEVSLHKNLPQ